MNSNFAIVLLTIACSGYFSVLVFWKSRYLALKSDPQRLIYISSAVGMLSMVLGFPVYSLLRSLLGVGAAAQFLSQLSATYPFAFMLVCFSAALLVWAVWWSDSMFILSYAFGLALSIWSWRRANPAFKRDSPRSGRAP